MSQTEAADPTPKTSSPLRLPRMVVVVAGIALLAGIVLLSNGWLTNRAAPERAVLGSTTLRADATARLPVVPSPVKLPSIRRENWPTIAAAGEADDASATSGDSASSTVRPQDSAQEDYKLAILGNWKQYSYGHRRLNVQPDGTATIDVTLDGFSAIAFGEKLHFDIEWSLEDDTLVFKTTGGTPPASINAVKSLYGNNRVYRILEINEKQMLLQEGDEKKTPWDRVTDADTPAAPQLEESESAR